ncbi:OVARIAN TUMOR DOMAIN-containing deubiquitinating enzyme 7-like isoform X4 [Primulina tabacum]|uniref:OVARIAN TUMOR DOMAIN-containing deubiquitinating enzyme 7-like isoform X4 n=1 Tax=Primulina tabacum TaxID=48773 RepID=UPI003F593D0D
MAKTKHQKVKPKPHKQAKQSHNKKGGKQADTSGFRAQLDALGLKIIQITADGNCFFRALADQLENNEDEHEKYRSMVARFIEQNNREKFEPFVEDEVPFDEYCRAIREDGAWAGNVELQAASLVMRINICIHRHMSPRWYIQNFDMHAVRMIHLSYHDGEHYNSLRSEDDDCSGPAKPIVIKGDADLSAKSKQPKVAATKSKHDGVGKVMRVESIALVKYGSGCGDTSKLEQALKEARGDVDAAIENLTAEQESVDQQISHDELSHSVKNSFSPYGNQDKDSEQHKLKVQESTCHPNLTDKLNEKIHKKNPQPDEKQKISRNKACPCGSKKKYKSCCGSVAGNSFGRFPVDQIVEYRNSGKDRKQGRRSGSNDEGQPDLGALCI